MTAKQTSRPAPLGFDPRLRASYRHWVAIPIRFSDQDAMGHVNNAAIAVYFEQGRCACTIPIIEQAAVADLDMVLARIVIDYVREMHYPGTVDVGIRLGRTGTRSLTLIGGAFIGHTCTATSEATLVFFDTRSRRSTLPPPALVEAFRALA